MSLSAKLPPGVRRLFRLPLSRRRLAREMDDEMAIHLAMRVEELRALGMSEADAWAEARRRFGDLDDFRKHTSRRADARTRRLSVSLRFADFAQDVRAALRQVRRTPVLSAIVVLILSLTIGATTAVYGVVRHLLIAPLPYPDGNRIVSLEIRDKADAQFRWDIGPEEYKLWSARSRTLEDFAGYAFGRSTIAVTPDDPRRQDSVKVGEITPSFLAMLRVHPLLGRDFSEDDTRGSRAPVVILSHSLWQERFGADRNVIGRSIAVDGIARTIVGVLPPRAGPPVPNEIPPALWLPTNADHGFQGFARLRRGVTSATASRELDALLHTIRDSSSLMGRGAEVRTTLDRLEPQQRSSVEVLFAAACCLLVIACADVAGLLLMRGWTRRREFAIRQALGAGRARLARLLLTESLLLAVPSGGLGIFVAWIGLRPQILGYFAEVHLDGAIVSWTALISLTTVVVFGAGPAFLAWERSLERALRVGGTGSGTDKVAGRAHIGLVVAQIALSLVFLAAAGILGRSFVALVRTPIGYEPAGLVEVTIQRSTTPGATAPTRSSAADRAALIRTLREALAATPGVTEVAAGTIPMTNIEMAPTAVESPTGVRPTNLSTLAAAHGGPEYFRVARIPIVRGRPFDANSQAANETIISETLARYLWPDRDAVGARLRLGEDRWATVVGVAGDTRMPGRNAAGFFNLQMYYPTSGASRAGAKFILRTRMDPARIRPVLARAVEQAGVGATLADISTAESTLEYAYRPSRYALAILGAFALLAIVLAAVGLFGIVAFGVTRRTREIGIRVTLGADPAALARMILGQTVRLVGIGCVIGLVGAFAASRGLESLVYGVSATDPLSIIGAIVLLAIIGVVASAFPVRRALGVDPTVALRAE
jgi:putative ABC transport system permease protein